MRRSLATAPLLVAAALGAAAADAPPPAAGAPPPAAGAPPPAPGAPRPTAADRPRVLVLPLPASHAIDPGIARAFDARLLVALDDTRRVITVTPSEEPDCTSTSCLAALGAAEDAAFVLSLSAVREPEGLTLFGTLVDARSATAARRIEVARLDPATLARTAPAEVVPQIVAPPPGPTVLGFARPTAEPALGLALALHDRLAAYRTFKVLPLGSADRTSLTHRAELVIDELSVVDRRRGLCTWRDGTLTGTFSIIELATGRVAFSRTVRLADSQRALVVSRDEVVGSLLDAAVADWVASFHRSGMAERLRRPAAVK